MRIIWSNSLHFFLHKYLIWVVITYFGWYFSIWTLASLFTILILLLCLLLVFINSFIYTSTMILHFFLWAPLSSCTNFTWCLMLYIFRWCVSKGLKLTIQFIRNCNITIFRWATLTLLGLFIRWIECIWIVGERFNFPCLRSHLLLLGCCNNGFWLHLSRGCCLWCSTTIDSSFTSWCVWCGWRHPFTTCSLTCFRLFTLRTRVRIRITIKIS